MTETHTSPARVLVTAGGDSDDVEAVLAAAPDVEAVAAADAEAALSRLADVDAVVSGHRPPTLDGLALLAAVRERRPALPFVLAPADGDEALAARAVAAGVTEYVPSDAPDRAAAVRERVAAALAAGGDADDPGDADADGPGDADAADPGIESGGDASILDRRVLADGDAQMPIEELPFREQLRLKERAMDEAPVGITISDPALPDNPLIYANESFARLTGFSPAAAVGRNCRFLQGEESDPDAIREMREAIEADEPVSVELINYRKDGEKFWNRIDIAPIRDATGEVTNYVGFQTDVTARKRAEFEVERERERLAHLLDRVNGLLQDVTQSLVQAVSRQEVERAVCERVADTDTYSFGWIGEQDLTRDVLVPTAWAGDWEPSEDALEVSVGGETDSPTAAAAATRETQVVQDPDAVAALLVDADWVDRDAVAGVAAIPLAYGETLYGVLTVYSTRQGALDERETVVLEALGRATATALNALERGRMLAADDVVELEFEVRDRALFFVDLAATGDCEVEYNGSVSRDDGSMLMFFTTDVDPDVVESVAASHPEVSAVTVVRAGEDATLYEFVVDPSSLVTTLAGRGATTRSIVADDGAARVVAELPSRTDARGIVSLLKDRYDQVDVVAFRERERPPETRQEFLAELEDRLTERQLTALKSAYLSGFYDWNRGVSGDELAASMDVARSTFHQHLRAAERKLVTEFFER